jgi:hypothetical protein
MDIAARRLGAKIIIIIMRKARRGLPLNGNEIIEFQLN